MKKKYICEICSKIKINWYYKATVSVKMLTVEINSKDTQVQPAIENNVKLVTL